MLIERACAGSSVDATTPVTPVTGKLIVGGRVWMQDLTEMKTIVVHPGP